MKYHVVPTPMGPIQFGRIYCLPPNCFGRRQIGGWRDQKVAPVDRKRLILEELDPAQTSVYVMSFANEPSAVAETSTPWRTVTRRNDE